jgi:hypothetical protein
VVVVGTNEEVESEGFDRTNLALPWPAGLSSYGRSPPPIPAPSVVELGRTGAPAMGG